MDGNGSLPPAPFSLGQTVRRSHGFVLHPADLRGPTFRFRPNSRALEILLHLLAFAWEADPAASLPGDSRRIAQLLTSDLQVSFAKGGREALRDWVLCDDDRYYHPLLVNQAQAILRRARSHSAAAGAGVGAHLPAPAEQGRIRFKRLPDGTWGIEGRGLVPGERVTAWRADGSTAAVIVGVVVGHRDGGYDLAEIIPETPSPSYAPSEGNGGAPDEDYSDF